MTKKLDIKIINDVVETISAIEPVFSSTHRAREDFDIIYLIESMPNAPNVSSLTAVQVIMINKCYSLVYCKIQKLKESIPQFAEIAQRKPLNLEILEEEAKDTNIYNGWYDAIERLIGRDPMSLSMPFSIRETNLESIGKYIRYLFDDMVRDIKYGIGNAQSCNRKKVLFADECCDSETGQFLSLEQSTEIDMSQEAVQYRTMGQNIDSVSA